MQYTEDQQKVIDLRDRNILVSAAAGSGKTAVLVERIIQKICDEQHPVDIDKMLIVTFTSASAAEMRERISKAITGRLEEDPSNEHLQKQSALIHHALITTIDSFCLFLIRNHFHEIELDPAFRVADEAEGKLLRKDAMQELLESKYAAEEQNFVQFVESYATNGSEKAMEEAIYRLYDFAISYPWPKEWLLSRKKDYEVNTVEELEQQEWFQSGMVFLKETLQRCKDRIALAKTLAESVNGPHMYLENLQKDNELLDSALTETDFEKLGEKLAVPFSRLSTKKDENVDAALRETVKNIRNDVKDQIAALQDIFFPVSVKRTVEDMKNCQTIVSELVDLTIGFMDILAEKKREKNIVDFADMEHFALQILLTKDEEGNYQTTDTAKVYQSYFEEVMIDEYQDSNLVQELLLTSVSGEEMGNYNRFMVGDVKQSIYKFRLARPEIFLEKYGQYTHEESKKQRIDLSKNFRSRIEVTESVNLICSRLMQKEVGGVAYDKYAALYAGADYEPAKDTRYATEFLISTKPESEEKKTDKMEIEARCIAAKIKSLVGSLPVRTKEGKYTPAGYKDIVILLRSTVGWEGILRRVFAEEGIPLHMASRSGYFQTTEVITVINFLRVLDNPLQDVALFGVLKSPFFQFSEAEIAKIRAMTPFRKAKLYTFLKAYAQGRIEDVLPEEETEKAAEKEAFVFDGELQEKVKRALEQIAIYRKKVSYMPISELIRSLLKDSHYEEYILAMPDGEQRKANIDFLLEQAASFEKTSFYGLFHFIRYLEEIREQEVDFGEVNILDENADVVRMMTIHKSKGLEFPVCIVAGLSKQFNQMDSRKNILLDIDLGIGTDYINPQQRIKRKTLRKNLVKWKMELDSRGEDLRVLYVALTRAKEKLILSAYDDKIEKTLQVVEETQEPEVPSYLLLQAQNYEKLILASMMKHPVMKKIMDGETCAFSGCIGKECSQEMYLHQPGQIPLQIQIYQEKDLQEEKVKENVTAYMLKERLKQAAALQSGALKQKIEDKFAFVYPYSDLQNLTTKTTVSELKKKAFHEEAEGDKELFAAKEKEAYVPAFAALEETKVKGNVRGTLYHKLMERIDYQNIPKDQAQLEAFIKEQSLLGFFEKDYIDLFSVSKIENFLHSKLARRMEEAAKNNLLYKEQPFVLGIPADRLSTSYDKSETVLIQGVIDVFFEEEDGIVLLDYKTDLVKTQEELLQRYRVQLQYYKEAIEAILEKKVKEIYIYSFSLQKEILLT